MYYCWSQDANERPTFAEIIKMLDKLLHTEMDYIELERFPDHNYYNIVNLSGEKLWGLFGHLQSGEGSTYCHKELYYIYVNN